MGVHDVDAMQWIARSRIVPGLCPEDRGASATGNEDALYAVVNFENGAIGCIDYSWAWPDGLMNGYRAALEIVGTRSAAYLDCTDQGFYTVSDERHDAAATPISGRRSTAGSSATSPTRSPISSTRCVTGRPFVQDYREAFDAISGPRRAGASRREPGRRSKW